jgi:hypothetical protein
MALTEIEERPLKRAMLDTTDCFILETFDKVVAWIGKKADPLEKKNAMSYAGEFIKKYNKPKHTKIERCPENCEDTDFKIQFSDWYKILTVHGLNPDGIDRSLPDKVDITKTFDT